MGRNVVMVHGFTRGVSVPGHLYELTSMFTIRTALVMLCNTVVNIKGSLCVVVCPTPPLTSCVWMSVGVGMSELV